MWDIPSFKNYESHETFKKPEQKLVIPLSKVDEGLLMAWRFVGGLWEQMNKSIHNSNPEYKKDVLILSWKCRKDIKSYMKEKRIM